MPLFFCDLFYVVPVIPNNFLAGIIAVILFVILSILSGKIDVNGGIVGGIIALCLFLGGGFFQMGYLFLFFIAGSAASAFKIKEKQKVGLAEKNKGKRSYNNAIANAGISALLGISCWFFPQYFDVLHLMLAASFASASSDTFSSEFGNYFGKHYFNVITFNPDKRGLDGVVSLEGSLAGIMGSFLIACYFFCIDGNIRRCIIVILAGIAGNLCDSFLGATLQRKGLLNNDTVNFLNTLLAALLAIGIYQML